MPQQAERVPRKPYETAASKREAWIEKIRDRYNRTPTSKLRRTFFNRSQSISPPVSCPASLSIPPTRPLTSLAFSSDSNPVRSH
jgi:hypothetical protein